MNQNYFPLFLLPLMLFARIQAKILPVFYCKNTEQKQFIGLTEVCYMAITRFIGLYSAIKYMCYKSESDVSLYSRGFAIRKCNCMYTFIAPTIRLSTVYIFFEELREDFTRFITLIFNWKLSILGFDKIQKRINMTTP